MINLLYYKTKRQIEVINDDEPIKYRKEIIKVKFESKDYLFLSKTFSISDIIIVAASVLEKMVNIIHNFFFT